MDDSFALTRIMMVETDAFTRFENCRQFCSVYLCNTVYTKLDKGIKTLLNLTALSITKKNDSELNN